jgi:hypothetical protein
MSRVSGNPGIPGKKVQFSVFRTTQNTAYFWKIGKKFPGKSDVFGKFPENQNPENSEIRKISEKNAKTSILENSTLVCRARFKTHILRAKIDKKK